MPFDGYQVLNFMRKNIEFDTHFLLVMVKDWEKVVICFSGFFRKK